MSRTALKKELNNMTAGQLKELLLDMYDFRLSPREYFSFFLEPDADSLLQKYTKAIDTELSRGSTRKIRARIMVINRLIKNFDSYKTGLSYNLSLKLHALGRILLIERHNKIPASLEKGACRLLTAIIREADLNQSADSVMVRIKDLLTDSDYGTRHMKQLLNDTLLGLNN